MRTMLLASLDAVSSQMGITMNIRRITTAVAAGLGAAALALAPTLAHAADATSLKVGTNTSGTYSWSGVGKSGQVTADIQNYGVVTCTSATASGSVTAGALTPGSQWGSITGLTLNCPSIIPGAPVTITLNGASKCAGGVLLSGANTLPSSWTGKADLGNNLGGTRDNCIHVDFAGVCHFDLWGPNVTTTFTEAPKANGTQQLTLDGTLTMSKVGGFFCPSTIVANGNTVTLHVPLDVTSGSGLWDF